MNDLIWILPPPWDRVVLVSLLVIVSGLVFWFSFAGYHRRYFFDKALQLAFWRTLGWLFWYGGSLALVFWLVTLVWPGGWLRYLAGSLAWGVLSETLLAFGWKYFDRLLEVL